MAVAQLKTKSNVQVLLSCNWGFLGDAGHTHCHSDEEIRIQGTKGTICGHSNDLSVYLTEPNEQEIKPEIEGSWFPHAFGNVMVHLIDSLEKGEKADHRWAAQSACCPNLVCHVRISQK